jgi:hypothetical protein
MNATEPKPPATASKIFGHVYSADGSGLKSGKVFCGKLETRTLADGLFVFNNLIPGRYEVIASLQGFRTSCEVATTREGEEAIVNLHLSKAEGTAKICGHIYDTRSKTSVSMGGTIKLILPIANKYKDIDKNGYYEFENLPADTYRILTSIPGYADSNVVLAVSDGETKTYDFFCRAQNTEEPPWG